MGVSLPGAPPGYNRNDLAGTVKSLCSYLRVLHENLNFQLSQVNKREDESAKAQEKTRAALERLEERIKALEDKQQTGSEGM